MKFALLMETVGGEGNYTYEWDLGDGRDFRTPIP